MWRKRRDQLQGRNGGIHTPMRPAAGRRFQLGRNKELFDAGSEGLRGKEGKRPILHRFRRLDGGHRPSKIGRHRSRTALRHCSH